MSRPRWSRQEVRCCNRFGLGQGFYVAIEFGQGKEFLCRDRVWSRPGVSMLRQSIFVSQHSLVKAKSFYVATEYFYVTTEFGQGQEFLCRDKVFCVAIEFGLDRGF